MPETDDTMTNTAEVLPTAETAMRYRDHLHRYVILGQRLAATDSISEAQHLARDLVTEKQQLQAAENRLMNECGIEEVRQ
jgi:hypothetical protein